MYIASLCLAALMAVLFLYSAFGLLRIRQYLGRNLSGHPDHLDIRWTLRDIRKSVKVAMFWTAVALLGFCLAVVVHPLFNPVWLAAVTYAFVTVLVFVPVYLWSSALRSVSANLRRHDSAERGLHLVPASSLEMRSLHSE